MMNGRYHVLRGKWKTSARGKQLLGVCALVCTLAAVGSANTIQKDPQMGMEAGGDPLAFLGGTQFTPDENGGGVFQYFNDTGGTILSVTFVANIGANVTDLPPFSCNNASDPTAPNPFFLFCSINYFANNGNLQFIFFGTNPGTGGPDEGIPALGNFDITLNDGFSLTVDQGGWNQLNDPTFTATNVNVDPSPEPAPAFLVGLALLFGAGWWLRNVRRGTIPGPSVALRTSR